MTPITIMTTSRVRRAPWSFYHHHQGMSIITTMGCGLHKPWGAWSPHTNKWPKPAILTIKRRWRKKFLFSITPADPRVARALAEKYQSDILTDDEIHSGTPWIISWSYLEMTIQSAIFALDLTPTGAMCPVPSVIWKKPAARALFNDIVAYAHYCSVYNRLYLRVWAKDLKAEGFCKKCQVLQWC